MMITVYIYEKSTGDFVQQLSAGYPAIADCIPEEHDFTLTPPPLAKDGGCYWDGVSWKLRLPDQVGQLRLARQQANIWEVIKSRRQMAIISGVYVASVDKVFHTDETSVIQYNNIGNMIALGNYEPIQWKVMDNSWITMTEEVFKELQKSMVQNTNRLYQVAEEHKAKMMVTDNPEEYDYSTGWEVSVS